jgi:hypothetical protein
MDSIKRTRFILTTLLLIVLGLAFSFAFCIKAPTGENGIKIEIIK